MELKDWISLVGIISSLIVALMTMLISHRRELRQEKNRKEEREQESKQRIEEKRLEAQYSKLHEKRVETLSELYSKLAETNMAVRMLQIDLEFLDTRGSEIAQANEKCYDCDSFFARNRLYLSKELAKQIGDVLSSLTKSATNIMVHQEANEHDQLQKDLIELKENSKVIDETLSLIESEFRELLGSSG